MSACYLVFRCFLKSGDHILTQHGLYHEISDQIIADKGDFGVDYSLIEDHSIENFEKSIRKNTKLIFVESPTNPVMFDVDIQGLAKLCNEKGVILIVDNTFLTQEYQKPLELGAHLTLYSTTKSINGHGDAMGGIISTHDINLYNQLRRYRDNTGLIMDPFSAWLTIRGLKTIRLRLEKQSENAKAVVAFLRRNYPQYKVLYPEDCQYAKKNQTTGTGGIVSLVLHSKEQGTAFMNHLSLFKIGTTFGNLESLCYHFATFTRPSRDISKIGLPQGLVRLSIGIENVEDIIDDIKNALDPSEEECGKKN